MAPASTPACRLCAGPLAPSQVGRGFCCEGCAAVAQILDASGFRGDRRGSAAFLEAGRAGLVPGEGGAAAPGPAAAAGESREASLGLQGLWCPSCGWLVESVLARTPGVLSARVAFFADLCEVRFDPARIDEAGIERRIERLGYRVRREREARDRGPLLRFGIAALLQMNVMWLSYALYAHGSGQGLEGVARLLPWLLAALSAPVVFGAGAPMLSRAWRALRERALVMDSLISLAAVTAWLYSLAAAARGSSLVYFDGAAGLVTFRLLGRLLEQAAFRRAGRAAEAVRRLLPRKARRLGGDGPRWAAAEALVPGDRIRAEPGERVPVDGRVVAGVGRVSTAVVDGEPRPRPVRPGDLVPGGSTCGETALDLEVTAPASASLLARVADHVARASGRRGPAPEVADALARVFLPGVLALAAATGVAWAAAGLAPGLAFERALSVLVVSCPCALGIAAPLCRVVAAGALARRGVIARGEGALDQVADARLIAFDKTGTLTQGRPVLEALEAQAAGREEALAALAALEARSGHPIAQAAREAAGGLALPTADGLQAAPGQGVSGALAGEPAWAGKPGWVESLAGPAPAGVRAAAAREEAAGRTVVLLAWGAGRWAALSFGDALRPDAAAAVADLRGLGLETLVLSGDGPQAAAAAARAAGAGGAAGALLPEDKARALERAASEAGRRPIFVGDGINDAPGLAAAVGVAVASGTDFARETADVLLLEPGLAPIPGLVRYARRARRAIRQNLAWAAVYNAALVPLAAAGRLTPVWAAAAMVTSGLLVVLNALRLQPPRRLPAPEGEAAPAPLASPA
ncbi:MAG TPA: heavy metal translocating P-type ATPase [Anaeromyxobacteraceae bacterium]